MELRDEDKNKVHDLVIIGGGPAGISAAIYGQRAMLDEIVIEKDFMLGGQIMVTERVDNYPGLYGDSGFELATKLAKHAEELGISVLNDEIERIVDHGDKKEIFLSENKTIYTKNIILATGAKHRKLGCKGEEKFQGAGVSYCATCDGAFFKNKIVAVVGGGDVALGDALYLSNLCEKVYLIHRREELRGAKVLQQQVFEKKNIEFVPGSEITEIIGENIVEKIHVKSTNGIEEKDYGVQGVFIAVGMEPNSNLVKELVKLDENGYIVAREDCRTSREGIYAVGDVRTKQLRQVVTAVADGAVAVSSIEQDKAGFMK